MTRSCSILVTFLRETDARGGRKTMKIALIVTCLLAVPCVAVAQDGRMSSILDKPQFFTACLSGSFLSYVL